MILRATSGKEDPSLVRDPEPGPPPLTPDSGGDGGVAVADRDDEGEGDDDDSEGQVVAVTSDGSGFVPYLHSVLLVPPDQPGEEWKVGAGITSKSLRAESGLRSSWSAGDFTGARVVRGAADEGPWLLEALGREGEYTAFGFETREGADAARTLFESLHIVRVKEDDDGRPAPPSAEQFAEAKRIFLETEAALDLPDDDERPA